MSVITVTGRSALAISRSLVASRRPWSVFQTHGYRRRETNDSGAYLSGRGRGSRCFCRHALITIVTPLSPRQCKYGLFSLPLHRKRERSLFTAALEQTSNVPTARNVGQLFGHVRRQWGTVIVRERRRVPSGDCPPPSHPRRRSNSDHAGKSTYSGEIKSLDQDPGLATLVPGMRFPGN